MRPTSLGWIFPSNILCRAGIFGLCILILGYLWLQLFKGKWCLNYWQSSNKDKSEKWLQWQDMHLVNAIREFTAPLQADLLTPVTIPKEWSAVMLDLKDCFYTGKETNFELKIWYCCFKES